MTDSTETPARRPLVLPDGSFDNWAIAERADDNYRHWRGARSRLECRNDAKYEAECEANRLDPGRADRLRAEQKRCWAEYEAGMTDTQRAVRDAIITRGCETDGSLA